MPKPDQKHSRKQAPVALSTPQSNRSSGKKNAKIKTAKKVMVLQKRKRRIGLIPENGEPSKKRVLEERKWKKNQRKVIFHN